MKKKRKKLSKESKKSKPIQLLDLERKLCHSFYSVGAAVKVIGFYPKKIVPCTDTHKVLAGKWIVKTWKNPS